MKRAMSNILSHTWMIINGEFHLANKNQIIIRWNSHDSRIPNRKW